jgi:hypothetical protein
VLVGNVAGKYRFEKARDVFQQTGFIFDGAYGGGGADGGHAADTLLEAGFAQYRGYFVGDIMDIAKSRGTQNPEEETFILSRKTGIVIATNKPRCRRQWSLPLCPGVAILQTAYCATAI